MITEPQENIYTALLKFQQLNIGVAKAGNNPAFHSKYMQLDDVLEAVTASLNQLGVLIIQSPGEQGVTTRLISVADASEVTGFIPYTNTADAQKLGGCITYARRYALVAMLNLGAEDDDGQTASVQQTAPAQQTAPTQRTGYVSPAVAPLGGLPGLGQTVQIALTATESVPKGTTSTGNPYWTVTTDHGRMTSYAEMLPNMIYDCTVKGGSYNDRPTYSISKADVIF